MEYDTERLADECEKLIRRMRLILKGKSGQVMMTSLSYIMAESMFNVSNPENWEKNMRNVSESVLETLQALSAAAKVTEGEVQ